MAGFGPRAGAATAIATAERTTTIDQSASAHRQSPCASGSTPTGVVRLTGNVSPISTPLLYTAVAIAIRAGNHSRTIDGKAGWHTATPTPIRNVAEKRTVVLGPIPRKAPKRATIPRPAMSAPRTPSLAMSSEPGTAAVARSSTGRATRAPTAFSSKVQVVVDERNHRRYCHQG